jgi:protein SCO1
MVAVASSAPRRHGETTVIDRAAKVVFIAFLLLVCTASADTPDIGIDEKLGQFAALDTMLLDEHGDRVRLGTLIDKPTVLTLNYFRCTGICSPLLNGVAEVIPKTGAVAGKDFQILTVSFDPRDNPEIAGLKKNNYVTQLGPAFPPSAWRFLTGDPASTKRLADSVGFRFQKVQNDYVHPGAIMILSPDGKVTRYMYGIKFLPFDLKMALLEAAQGRPGPTINKLLQLCYSYDPAGRTYFFNVTRVVGLFTVLLVGAFVAVTALKRGRAKPRGGPS